MPLYPTAWYSPYTKALVFSLDNKLSNNIPKNKSFVAVSSFTSPSTQIHYQDGYPSVFSGWKKSQDGNWYYFDKSYNSAVDRWIKNASGQYYYVKGNGIMAIGWVYVNGYWYYMDSNGIMTTGWQKIGGKWYYMNASGQMLTGRQRIGMDYYYFSSLVLWQMMNILMDNTTIHPAYGSQILLIQIGCTMQMVTGTVFLMEATPEIPGCVYMEHGIISMLQVIWQPAG